MNYWIDITEKQPELYQAVAFIVDSSNKVYHKRRMGGTYQGRQETLSGDGFYHECAVPGHSWVISHWMPLPDLPPCNCGFQHDEKYN